MSGEPFDPICFENLHSKFEFLFEPELISELCKIGTITKYRPKEVILELGFVVELVPMLISGSVKIMTIGNGGHELLLYYLDIGDTCSLTLKSSSGGHKSRIRAIAESESELLFFPVEFLEAWIIKYESWRKYILESYRSRMNEMIEVIDNLAFCNMENRIRSYLKDKVWVTKSPVLNITHSNIAKDLNSSRVVISRIMKELEKEGLFKQSRHRIEMLKY